jgi:HK97 family phage major capsid protein
MPALWQILVEERAAKKREADAIVTASETRLGEAKANGESPDSAFTDEERTKLTALRKRLDQLDEEDIPNARAAARADLNLPAINDPAALSEEQKAALGQADADKLPTPFKSLGQQLVSVMQAGQNPHATDQRLLDIQAAALGLNEGVPSAGGFLVQTDFAAELLKAVYATGILPGKTDRRPVSENANGMKINAIDETSRVDGSRQGGVQVYWTGEAGAFTSSKPTFRQIELTLNKLSGLYYATDEELRDTSNLEANVTAFFSEEFGFKLDDAIVRGSGAGQPLGFLGHAGTVSVAKETTQDAATILAENIQKMFSRLLPRSLGNAEWYINQACWPQLFQLAQAVGVGGVPVFLPPGGLSAAPFGTLLGRPITPIEHCAALGTVGDIMLADLSQYLMIEKGGLEAASSMHVQFLTDEMTFRFILRTDGQPKRNSVLTPYKGSDTLSAFVTLATRG